jgi:hypothetical protein
MNPDCDDRIGRPTALVSFSNSLGKWRLNGRADGKTLNFSARTRGIVNAEDIFWRVVEVVLLRSR